MKKTARIFAYILFVCSVLFPFILLVSECFDCTVELRNPTLISVVMAVISIITLDLCIAAKKPVGNQAISVILVLTAPLSVINSAFFIVKYESNLMLYSMAVYMLCCLLLAIIYGNPAPLQIIAVTVFCLILIPVGLGTFFSLLFDWSSNTVVQTVPSPKKYHYAEVIDHDEGALGGATIVKVHEPPKLDVIVFYISKKPQTVYYGDWGEFETMRIQWKTERCLVINSVEYDID
jgi:hypothetical protein